MNFENITLLNKTQIETKEYLNEICHQEEKTHEVTEANLSGEILLMMILLTVSIIGGHILKKYKVKIFSECMLAVLLGFLTGFLMKLFGGHGIINNITDGYVKFFLIILLPPIIFEGGYNLEKTVFMKNLGTILTFAVLGTLIAIMFTAISVFIFSKIGLFVNFNIKESFGLASMISATDTVAILNAFKEINCEPSFYIILFGESILNDAVSIVFYQTTINFNEKIPVLKSLIISFLQFCSIMIFSITLGYLLGFLTAWLLKVVSKKTKKIEQIEISAMTLLPFVSYLCAEMLNLSGIVALLFNGIAHSTYTKPNLKKFSKISIKAIYEVLAGLFETLVYIFIGFGFSGFSGLFSEMKMSLLIFLSIIVFLARALNVYICSRLCNLNRKTNKIDKYKQVCF